MQRLVAHLGLSGCSERAAIAGQLWPDVPEEHAQGSLRSLLWRLQKAAPWLVNTSNGTLQLEDGVTVDVHELNDWAHRLLNPYGDGQGIVSPPGGMHSELLPGWYDDWVLLERERVRQVRIHGLERLAERLACAGRFSEAIEAAQAAVVAEPLRESSHRALVRVHLAEGNIVEALREYELTRKMLADELGVRPTPLMEALVYPVRVRQSHRSRP